MSYTVGIDLTPQIATKSCGMVNLFMRLLSHIPEDSETKLVLFVNEASKSLYEPFLKTNILQSALSPNRYNEAVERIDILHSPFNKIYHFVPGAESILTKCDLIPDHFPLFFRQSEAANSIHQCTEADHIITISNYARDDIILRANLAEEDISVLYCPLEREHEEASRISSPGVGDYIIYPAAGRQHKNHVNLFRAMQWIDKKLVLTTGEVHGAQQFNELKRLAESKGVADRVEICGHVSVDELAQLYRHAAALVFPSRSEGFGYPLVEAMSHGLPIACAFSTSIPEVVEDAGLYFDPLNPEDIASKVNELLSNEKLRDTLKANGDRVLRKYDGEAIARRLLELYKARSHISRLNAIRARRNYHTKSRLANRNILTEMQQIPTLDVSRDLCILMDCTRLFDGNPNSGIARYIRCLIAELLSRSNVVLVPFFNRKGRGYQGPGNDDTKSIRMGGKFVEVYKEEKAKQMALCLSRNIVFHSPFHPLPSKRDGRFAYCLTVFDILHLTRRDLYPDGSKGITSDIVESIQPDDEVIAISNFTAQELMSFRQHRLNVTIAYLSAFTDSDVSQSRVNTTPLGARSTLIVPFQSDPRKNFDLMLDVARHYTQHIDESADVCVFGKLERLSDEQRRKLDQMGRVDLVDTPTDSVMRELFEKSFCLLYLSAEEGFGLLPLEAMSVGCAPVMSRTQSLSEVYAGWPYLVGSTDVESIATAIGALKNSDAEELSTKMQAFVSEYTSDNLCRDHLAAYSEALRRRH